MLVPSMEALTMGYARRASAAARVTNDRYVSEKPLRAWNSALARSRARATLVMSTRWTVVTWAEVRLLRSMCSAMRWRMVDMGSMRVWGCSGRGSEGAAGGSGGAGAEG